MHGVELFTYASSRVCAGESRASIHSQYQSNFLAPRVCTLTHRRTTDHTSIGCLCDSGTVSGSVPVVAKKKQMQAYITTLAVARGLASTSVAEAQANLLTTMVLSAAATVNVNRSSPRNGNEVASTC